MKAGRLFYGGSAGFLSLTAYTAWKNQRNGIGFFKTLQTGNWSADSASGPDTRQQTTTHQNPEGASAGAIAELYWPDYDPEGGHQGHLHLAMTDKQALVKILTDINKMDGYYVSEHPLFGGVGEHSPNSHHYVREAGDINYRGTKMDERKALNILAAWIQDHALSYVQAPTQGGKVIPI